MTFEDIEDKIIADLKTLAFKTVETYAGQLEQDIESLPIMFPAAYVIYGGSDFEWVDGPNHNESCEFTVLIAVKNLRGQATARKDDAAGAYKFINDVLIKLTNQTWGLNIEKFIPAQVALIFISKTVVIYGIDFKTNFDKTFN